MESSKSTIFREYEDGFIIRSMTVDDIQLILEWYSSYCSKVTDSFHELNTIVSIYPPGAPGSYIGEYDGEAVASGVTVHWGNGIYVDDYYYTKEEFRGRGFSTRLREEMRKHQEDLTVLVINSFQGNVALSNRDTFGFKYTYETARYRGKVEGSCDEDDQARLGTGDAEHNITVEKTSDNINNFEEIIKYDNKCFITKDFPYRRKFLKEWITIPKSSTYVAYKEGHVIGYGCRIPAQRRHSIIGPLYAEDLQTARILLEKLCLEVPGEPVEITVCCANPSVISLMENFKFEKTISFDHMYSPRDEDIQFNDYKDQVYGMTSIGVCLF